MREVKKDKNFGKESELIDRLQIEKLRAAEATSKLMKM